MSAITSILMLSRFSSVRMNYGEALLLVTVLACLLGGGDSFGGSGKVLPIVLVLVILQVASKKLYLLGANQHLSIAIWSLDLLALMAMRTFVAR